VGRDLRGRSADVSVLPRRDADRRLHHPAFGDRPDPHPPPDPRFPCGARPTPVRRRCAGHLRTAPTLRHHAGTIGVGGRPGGAAHWSPAASPRHSNPHSHGPRVARTRQRAGRRRPVGAHAVGDRAFYPTDPRPAPIEFPSPHGTHRRELGGRCVGRERSRGRGAPPADDGGGSECRENGWCAVVRAKRHRGGGRVSARGSVVVARYEPRIRP
jgi:hypothetical protein